MRQRLADSVIIPLLAVVSIGVFAGGLGIIFMLLYETALEAWAVVILGMALVVGVPSTAALVQWKMDRQ